MPKEVLTYQVQKETRRGPWGLLSRKERMGRVPGDQGTVSVFPLGSSNIAVMLDASEALIIMGGAKGAFTVELDAEPLRGRPKIVTQLDELHPEVRTNRRKVTVYPQQDNQSQRLVLEAPKFRPLMITRAEAQTMFLFFT